MPGEIYVAVKRCSAMSNAFHAGVHMHRSDVMKQLIDSAGRVVTDALAGIAGDAPVNIPPLRWER
jgi:hypothetical protein